MFLLLSVLRWVDQNLGGEAHLYDRQIYSFIQQMFHICPWKRWLEKQQSVKKHRLSVLEILNLQIL